MNQIGRIWQVTAAVSGIFVFMASSALGAAPLPPFFGPPNGTTTIPGLVNVNGSNEQAYPTGTPGATPITITSDTPWKTCFTISGTAKMDGNIPGKYNVFTNSISGKPDRFFTVNLNKVGDYYISGHYTGWGYDDGDLILTKSSPGKATYDQVHLTGFKTSGGLKTAVNVILSLVDSLVGQNRYIGVANLASLGAIQPCPATGANGSSQIWIPLGTGSNGQPTIIPDIDSDGAPDTQFLEGPPLSAAPASSISVPTLTEWGLIALALLLLILGLHFTKRNTPFATV